MRFLLGAMLMSLILTGPGCKRGQEPKPPVARVAAVKLEKHGETRIDNYFWLKERENPEVTSYLKAENAYTDAVMAQTAGLQAKLFEEFKTRIKQTDESAPYRRDGYFYYTRVEAGKDYPIYCRRKGEMEAPEQVMVDVNQVAAGHGFCSIPPPSVTSDGKIMAYAADLVGRRFYDVRFRNLETGKEYPDVIRDVTGMMTWAEDNRTLFYARQHPDTLRSYRIYRHVLGGDAKEDVLVYEEKDETFSTYVFKTKSKKYIMIASEQTLSSEYRFLDASKPAGTFRILQPRRRDHEYQVDHFGDHFYIRTNLNAKNFRLMKTPVGATAISNWREVIPHRADVLVEDMDVFKNHLVVTERKNGLIQLRVMPWSGPGEHYIDFGEPTYTVETSQNYDLDTPIARYRYSSLTTPPSVYDYDMVSREKKLVKRDEVLGGFDPANYQAERVYATAADGVRVPVSLVYRKGFKKNGSAPLLLYGYGSYGISTDASFDPFRISLLDRGFVYAIAHVRGGQEMGRSWYEDGKLLKKKNTFTDFVACGEFLVAGKYTSPSHLFAMGGSAGGLLMGAVVNMRPDLFKGVVARVPFVDVVTTMLDDSIPLTTAEYDEWGNPNEKQYYDYMLSYSPYDNVKPQNYPNLLVMTGLHDSQVQYWEPAKWVAKLRAVKTDHNRLLLNTEMNAGHGGVSGRDKKYKETAFIYSFLLDTAGK